MKYHFIISGLIIFVFFNMAAGQGWAATEGKSRPHLISWREILSYLQKLPEVEIAQLKIQLAQKELEEKKQYPNPEFSLKLGGTKSISEDKRNFYWDLDLTLNLDWLYKLRYEKKAVVAKIETEKRRLEIERIRIITDLRLLYLQIAFDQKQAELQNSFHKSYLDLLSMIKARRAKGDGSPLEVLRIQIEIEKLNIQKSKAAMEAKLRWQRLQTWLGKIWPANTRIRENLNDIPNLPEVSRLLAQKTWNHPVIKEAMSEMRGKSALIDLERSKGFPHIGIGAFAGQDLEARNYGALLTFSIPFWNWNAKGIERARLQEKKARLKFAKAHRLLKLAIIKTYEEARQFKTSIRKYRQLIIPKANLYLANLLKIYQSGEIRLFEVLEARLNLQKIRQEYVTLLFEYHAAYIKFITLMGGGYYEKIAKN